jgi:16S rRNA A1518/A1519 N6-dimethyltransferase RsmA/KsgA/DIM1 with predicted DNA glycosylase/AP lyase activity
LAPFVPVTLEVAEMAIEFAKVTEQDVLCDLGCGDARILATALETVRPRQCIGVELDSNLVELINQKQKRWIDCGSLVILQQDFMEADISNASVLICYLLPNALKLLSEKLSTWKQDEECRRIVTIVYQIPEWSAKWSRETPLGPLFYY